MAVKLCLPEIDDWLTDSGIFCHCLKNISFMIEKVVAKLAGVSKYYGTGEGRITALDRVDFEVNKGDFVVLAGLSGSGKSTMLHLLGCIDKQDEGESYIDGIDTTRMSLEQLAPVRLEKIGFVFQSFNLVPVLTAFENVELPLLFKGIDKNTIKSRVNDILHELGLQERMHHFPREMSGGQQQRVAIARALVTNPILILADEPTANLDSKTGADIVNLLIELNQKKNITVVLASHDSVVLDRIKHIVNIRDGKIISHS
jgi:putative ABC transport system ATP-binding protein